MDLPLERRFYYRLKLFLAFLVGVGHSMRTESRLGEAMSERFRRLYTASQGKYVTRAKANAAAATLENPHLTFFGTGTPDAFYDTLNSRMIENGMYGRCLVLKAEDRYVIQLPELCPLLDKAGGSLDRSTMLKNLHVDSQTFTRITLTLHMSDMIEEEWLDGRKVVFTLKNAA